MPKFKFDKLVRDKIVDHQIASGAKPKYRKLTKKELAKELSIKIAEESMEIIEAKPKDRVSEIADVQQAIDDLKAIYNLTDGEVKLAQKYKRDKNGAFKKGIYMEYVEVNEKDEWVKYYRKNAKRYPEIK